MTRGASTPDRQFAISLFQKKELTLKVHSPNGELGTPLGAACCTPARPLRPAGRQSGTRRRTVDVKRSTAVNAGRFTELAAGPFRWGVNPLRDQTAADARRQAQFSGPDAADTRPQASSVGDSPRMRPSRRVAHHGAIPLLSRGAGEQKGSMTQ